MQRCTYQLISKTIRIPVLQRYNYQTNSTKNKTTTEEDHHNNLICSKWEEAIIKEQRVPDTSFDLMQKDTITRIHEDKIKHKNNNNRKSH
ncbi:unnamed protein product [Adineta steineri]|uniref:Uncharacterized protein n=1 Tax=Adineta steineri TaxID=433720 RepID=A0A813MNR4_9BILA|nr:unnamed protein product [Adineta steineri]CAF1380801.1 unnamed protein product [Adineta steineri]